MNTRQQRIHRPVLILIVNIVDITIPLKLPTEHVQQTPLHADPRLPAQRRQHLRHVHHVVGAAGVGVGVGGLVHVHDEVPQQEGAEVADRAVPEGARFSQGGV